MRRRSRRDDDHDARAAQFERMLRGMRDYLDERGHGAGARRDAPHEAYARNVGRDDPRPVRHRLSRNPRDGKIAGVCAGVADYFDWNLAAVRASAIVLTVFTFPLPIIIYAALAMVLPAGQPIAALYDDPEDARFWRTYSARPRVSHSELRHRFRALDARVASMERAVTSDEYSLRREFNDLEGRS